MAPYTTHHQLTESIFVVRYLNGLSKSGLEVMKKLNEEKAAILYDYLDSSSLFKGTVVKEDLP